MTTGPVYIDPGKLTGLPLGPGKIMQATGNYRRYDPMQMIGMRLHIPDNQMLPFEFIAAHLTDKGAFVFIVSDSKPVVLEDDPSLFPSDALITQLRLLIGAKP